MSTLYGTRKYAIEGDNAAKVYDASWKGCLLYAP